MKRIAYSGIGLALVLALTGLPASAQNQAASSSQSASGGTSLGEYARQLRKSSGTTAKPRVFDNDNLPKQDKLSIVGTAPAEEDNSGEAKQDESAGQTTGETKPGAEDKSKSAGNTDQEKAAKEAAMKQWGDKLAAQKDQIDLLSRELDVLQREYQLRAAAMYADAGNRLRNQAQWDKQDAQYKQQIADKQKSVEDAKQKLDDMQEEARKAGVPSSVREP